MVLVIVMVLVLVTVAVMVMVLGDWVGWKKSENAAIPWWAILGLTATPSNFSDLSSSYHEILLYSYAQQCTICIISSHSISAAFPTF